MENPEEVGGARRSFSWKVFFLASAIILGGFFGVVYSTKAYPKIFHIDVALEKNVGINLADPIVISFSQPVMTEGYKALKITPSDGFILRWEDANRKLNIIPKSFWRPGTQYAIALPQGKSAIYTNIDFASFKFSTVDYPEVANHYPEDGVKDVRLDIEDPMVVKFDKPLGDFYMKVMLEPYADVTYQFDTDRTEFKMLPKDKLSDGTDYKMKVYVKYKDDSDSNLKLISESSFSTLPPPPTTWAKDYATRLDQARKYTVAKIKTGKYIDVNLSAQILCTFQDGKLLTANMISSGKRGMETPKGEFNIRNKAPRVWSKRYGLYMPYWMAVASDGSVGIHELPEWPGGYKEGAAHLGIPVSHGCVRLGVGPAKEIYDWTDVGTPVVIY